MRKTRTQAQQKATVGITMLASVAISMKSVLTADQVLAKAEAQLKATSIIAEMKVSIQRPKWTKTMSK